MTTSPAAVSRALGRLMALLALGVCYTPCGAADLFRDDFSSFPPGWLTRPIGQLNAAIQEYHGNLRRVVMFPDDGHPDLAAYVPNVTGDARDEVILWDQQRVWIYTQDCPFSGERVYAPRRNPDYNESNYRTVVSQPGWAAVGRKAER